MVMKMLINSAIKNEEFRNSQMIEQYEKILRDLPKGSLICRKKEYYYLKYRKDGRIYDEYIGKNPDDISKVKEKLELRKHCEAMLSALKQERIKIIKVLEVLE